MFEMRIHGRGGQGAKSAAQFIAEAALEEGKFIQAFPEYGPERSGAPVVAYVRISDQEILTHEPISHPRVVLVLDEDLTETVNAAKGLRKNGILIINSCKKGYKDNANVKFIDASKIALEFIKKDKPNTVMLGALIKATQIVKIENLIKVIKRYFLVKLGEKETMANIMAAKKGYDL